MNPRRLPLRNTAWIVLACRWYRGALWQLAPHYSNVCAPTATPLCEKEYRARSATVSGIASGAVSGMASETAVLLSLTVQCSLSRMRGDGIVSHLRNDRARFAALVGGQCGEYLPHLLAQIVPIGGIEGGATTRNGSDERANSGHWYELVALAMPEIAWEVTDSVQAESPAMGAETHIPGMAPCAAPERLQRFLVDR